MQENYASEISLPLVKIQFFILRWLILIVFVPDKYFSIVPLCFWNKVVQLRAILLAKLQSRKIEDFSVKSVHYILRLLLPTIERG